LEESLKPGEKQQTNEENQPDIPAEDNAIEMTDDFDGKLNDGDKQGLTKLTLL